MDFMELGGRLREVNSEGSGVGWFVGQLKVGLDEEIKVSEDLMLWKSIEKTYQVIIDVFKVGGRVKWVMGGECAEKVMEFLEHKWHWC